MGSFGLQVEDGAKGFNSMSNAISYAIVKKLSDNPIEYRIQKDIHTNQLEIYENLLDANIAAAINGTKDMEVVEIRMTRVKEVQA